MKNRIKELRTLNSISQSQLAKEISVSRQAISLYEQGSREPKLETWQKLADALNVSVPYLQGVREFNGEDLLSLGYKIYAGRVEAIISSQNGLFDDGIFLDAWKYFDIPEHADEKKALIIDAGNRLIDAWGVDSVMEWVKDENDYLFATFIIQTAKRKYLQQVKNNQNAIYTVLDAIDEFTYMGEYSTISEEEWDAGDIHLLSVTQETGVSNALIDEIEKISSSYLSDIKKLLGKYPNQKSRVIEMIGGPVPLKDGSDTDKKKTAFSEIATVENGKIKRNKSQLTEEQEELIWGTYALKRLPVMQDPNFANSPEGMQTISKFVSDLLGKKVEFTID